MTISSSYAATMTLTGIVKRDDPSVVEVVALRVVLAHGVLERTDDEERDCDEIHQQQVGEAREDDDGERGRHAARTSSSRTASAARLGSDAVPLAAGLVDPLEERAARVVEGEEVDEADVLQHLGRPVPREGIVVSQDRQQRRNGVGAHPTKRVLRGGTHPPALVGEEPRDGRCRIRTDDVSRGARRVDAHEPLAVVEAREKRGSDCRAAPRSERLDRSGTYVGIGVPREQDESASPSTG